MLSGQQTEAFRSIVVGATANRLLLLLTISVAAVFFQSKRTIDVQSNFMSIEERHEKKESIVFVSTTTAGNHSHGNTTNNNSSVLLQQHQDLKLPDKNNVKQQHGNNNNITLPNVLLIGVQKSGTTALAAALFSKYPFCHAQTFRGEPLWYNKEVHFFDKPERYKQGIKFYSKRFLHCKNNKKNNGKLMIDATPSYLNDSIADMVYDMYDSVGLAHQVKIFAMLREPVARELSMYNHQIVKFVQQGRLKAPFTIRDENGKGFIQYNFTEYVNEVAIPDIIERGSGRGLYSTHLKQWFKRFDRKQILILSYDEYLQDDTIVLNRVLQFLGFEPPKKTVHTKQANTKNSKAKVTQMACTDHSKLAAAFSTFNEELYDLLESNPGPPMEQRPFPKFELGSCLPDS